MDTSTLHAILHAQIDLLLGEQRDAENISRTNESISRTNENFSRTKEFF